jgi:nitric oxide synthase oxygenase domain/subunit
VFYPIHRYDWFKELDIRWFTIPLLSAMLFDCGGLQFPAAPFNGWFTAPEIASRDLGDVNKYNYLKVFVFLSKVRYKNAETSLTTVCHIRK